MASAGLALLSPLLLVAPGCRGGSSGAVLAVEQAQRDFGAVNEGQVMEHSWRIAAHGSVRVTEAKSDCGCTLTSLSCERDGEERPYVLGEELGAGDVLLVRARYDTLGRTGRTTRVISLLHSAGLLELRLTAEIRPWLRVDPPTLAFAQVREGKGTEASFRVLSLTGEPFGLEATGRALPPWVALELTPEGASVGRAPTWRVRARLGAAAPRGLFSYPLELRTDVPIPGAPADAPRTHALSPVWSLQVVGPVALSRPSLEFGVVDPRATVSQSLRLQSFDEAYEPSAARARLVPVREGEPFPLGRTANVHLRPGPDGADIEVVFGGLDPAVSGTFLARLLVETGHPGLPELEALVRGTCLPGEARR